MFVPPWRKCRPACRSGHPSDLNYDHQPVDLSQTNPNTGEVVSWADRLTARRLMQISNIFKSVWTSAGPPNPIGTQVRPILGGQGPVLFRFTNMLTYISTVYGAPKNFFYGIGIAPYFGLNLYQDQPGANGQWTTLNQNITTAQALDGIEPVDHALRDAERLCQQPRLRHQVGPEAGGVRGRRGLPRAVQRPGQESRLARPGHRAAHGPATSTNGTARAATC